MRYDRARASLDRHATYIVAAHLAGAAGKQSTGWYISARLDSSQADQHWNTKRDIRSTREPPNRDSC